MSAHLVLAVLAEALTKFGSITAENNAEVAKWAKSRVDELSRYPQQPVKPFVPRTMEGSE